ncbi:MAG: PspC domain-containing protein [Thermomicrobiales bacterium]
MTSRPAHRRHPTVPPDSPEPVQSAGKRLQRSEDQRILLGVCGGLANYFDFDPTIVRRSLVLLAVCGSGLLPTSRSRSSCLRIDQVACAHLGRLHATS